MDLSLSGSDAVQQQEYDANDDSGISIAMTRVEEDDSGARGAREIHIDIRYVRTFYFLAFAFMKRSQLKTMGTLRCRFKISRARIVLRMQKCHAYFLTPRPLVPAVAAAPCITANN